MEAVTPSGLNADQRLRLLLVIAICGGAFVLEMGIGWLSPSQALKADSLDFLAAGLGYTMSLWARGQTADVRAGVALGRAALLLLLGLWIGLTTLYQFLVNVVPEPSSMGAGALAAVAANGVIYYLTRPQRADGDPLQAMRLGARNDAIGNAAVLLAAALVAFLDSSAPDLVVAGVMAVLFLSAAVPSIQPTWRAWQATQTPAAPPAGHDPIPHSPDTKHEAE
jgi:Co/Zn/Cd efflux system component